MRTLNHDINGVAIFLMGPTASGKTNLAISLFHKLPVELINADSTLIYRGMNIGTAKPSVEELTLVPHRLIDIIDPAESYSVAKFRCDALSEMLNITQKGKIPLLVGGSMLYFKVLLEGLSILPASNLAVRQQIKNMVLEKDCQNLHYQLSKIDPISASRIHPNDSQRILRALEVFFISGKTLTESTKSSREILPYNVYQFAIAPNKREILHQRIVLRYNQMLSSGFEEEVRILFLRKDLNKDMPSMRCVGYRQMWAYLSGEIHYDEMIHRGISATRQLAKRQITWLRKWPDIHWLDSNEPKLACKKVIKIINTIKK